MTESEAIEIIEACIECEASQNKVAYEEQCHENCDNCELCYKQCTVSEQKEAMNMAIEALEKQENRKR